MQVIRSLRLELESGRSETTLELIAPLDAAGRSRHRRPLSPKKQLIDLGAGQQVLHRGKVYRIRGVELCCWREVLPGIRLDADGNR